MTQDEIIELAMAYGFTGGFDANGNQTYDATFVKAVAEAVAKEREACAELAWDYGWKRVDSDDAQGAAVEITDLIRARGEA
jgi:hypothetical protein